MTTRSPRLLGPRRALACAVWLALSLRVPGPAAASEVARPPAPLTLDWCLERASQASPDLAVDAASADAAAQRARRVGALEDPRFSYEASNLPVDSWDFDSTPLSGHQLWLRQKLPFPGVLGNRRAAARAGSDAADLGVEERRLSVAAAVETAWAELGFAQRARVITDRNLALLRQLTAIAEAKYRVGSGLQQDVLRAHVELTVLLQERLGREAAVSATAASLAALLDLPASGALPITADLADDASLPDLDHLLDHMEDSSPLLRALSSRVEQARHSQRVAELEGYPDFDLGIGYRARKSVAGDPVTGTDFFSADVTIRLPVVRSRWRAQVAEASAQLRHEEARYRAARANLTARIRAEFAALVRSDAESRLLTTGLVPQARQSFESSRSGYAVGRTDFLGLIDSQVSLLRAELRGVRVLADRRAAFAKLEAAAGGRLR